MADHALEYDSSLGLTDQILIGGGCLVLLFVVLHFFYSCYQLVQHLQDESADNIFERTKSEKKCKVRGREFVFEQQYREAGMGVGSALWDGAIILSEYISDPAAGCDVRDKRVLVIGAGLGLEAMSASICGAKEVCCTDGDPLLLPLTRKNVQNNLTKEEEASIEVVELLWGQEDHIKTVKDWRSGGPYDVILAADVVYESSINMGGMLQAYEGLFETFLQLSTDKTLILLAYKERFSTEPLFFNIMNQYFTQSKVDVPEGLLTPGQIRSGTRIFRYARNTSELVLNEHKDD
jgi:hypothetical protein